MRKKKNNIKEAWNYGRRKGDYSTYKIDGPNGRKIATAVRPIQHDYYNHQAYRQVPGTYQYFGQNSEAEFKQSIIPMYNTLLECFNKISSVFNVDTGAIAGKLYADVEPNIASHRVNQLKSQLDGVTHTAMNYLGNLEWMRLELKNIMERYLGINDSSNYRYYNLQESVSRITHDTLQKLLEEKK